MKPLLILTAAFILLTFSGNTQNSIAVDWVKIYGAYPGGQATQVLVLKYTCFNPAINCYPQPGKKHAWDRP